MPCLISNFLSHYAHAEISLVEIYPIHYTEILNIDLQVILSIANSKCYYNSSVYLISLFRCLFIYHLPISYNDSELKFRELYLFKFSL